MGKSERVFSQDVTVYWMMGTPDCGKSLMCTYLGSYMKFVTIRVSRMVKKASTKKGNRAKILQSVIMAHQPVPTKILMNLFAEEFKRKPSKGYIIDGFPWNLSQAKHFESKFIRPSLIIFLQISLDGIMARMITLFGPVDLNDIRIRYIKSRRNLNSILKHYSKITLCIPSKYPAIEAFKNLLELMDIRGFQEISTIK